jgi:hypothetical protein
LKDVLNVETSAEMMRKALDKLFADAGYSSPELLAYIEKLEQDNKTLTGTVRKLKLEALRKAGSNSGMSTRLTDALRE